MYMRKCPRFIFCIMYYWFGDHFRNPGACYWWRHNRPSGSYGCSYPSANGSGYSTTTRKNGHYNLANLRVGGPYLIKVTFVGYGDEQRENVSLDLGQAYKANFRLKTSASTLSEVLVSGRRSDKIFNTSHTGSQEVVGQAQIRDFLLLTEASRISPYWNLPQMALISADAATSTTM